MKLTFPHELYERLSLKNNDIALVINKESCSYKKLSTRISEIQQFIGQKEGPEVLGIVAENHLDTYASILACWLLGKGFIPLHPLHPFNRNKTIIRIAKIQTILSLPGTYKNIPNEEVGVKTISKVDLGSKYSKLEVSTIQEDHIACILFTSGSTGEPKGVPMSFKNIQTTLNSFFALDYELSSEDKFLQMFELTFDMSLLSYLPAFLIGASVYTVGGDKIKYLESLNVMQQNKISFAAMVPSTLHLLKTYLNKVHLPHLRYSLLGGEPLPEELAKSWAVCIPNARIINISGPTEITMACMSYEVDTSFKKNKKHNGILAFGKPWKNTEAIIVDENLKEVKQGEIGELCFSGTHVMEGYLNKPKLNMSVFFEKIILQESYIFYRTGDMSFIDEDGIFHTCGRKDKQVKIQGFKVELEEIEQCVRKNIELTNVCSFILEQNGNNNICLALEGTELEENQVKEVLKKNLPYYMMPTNILILPKFPYNANGKLDRMTLSKIIESS